MKCEVVVAELDDEDEDEVKDILQLDEDIYDEAIDEDAFVPIAPQAKGQEASAGDQQALMPVPVFAVPAPGPVMLAPGPAMLPPVPAPVRPRARTPTYPPNAEERYQIKCRMVKQLNKHVKVLVGFRYGPSMFAFGVGPLRMDWYYVYHSNVYRSLPALRAALRA